MKRSSFLKTFKKILFLFSFLFFFFSPSQVFAKDYLIESADFKVNILEDGSAVVTEKRTYNFIGSFSWADEWIPLEGKCEGSKGTCENYKMSDFLLAEGSTKYIQNDSSQAGTYTLDISQDKLYLKWFYKATDTRKTFTLKYKIDNAVTNHEDISEFYWQLIGDEWVKGTGQVTASILLPFKAPDDQIWAFGHGPLDGKVEIVSQDEVLFSADSLASGKFFEVRVLFPKKDSFIQARTGEQNLEEILKEEERFAQKPKEIFI